jgi:hypothetical protein
LKTHIEDEEQSIDTIADELVQLAKGCDQVHRQQRKVQFFLDIRGYLTINNIKGSYIEFGVYRGEMMFSAHHVLGETGSITDFIGLDTFVGEPKFNKLEEKANPALVAGDYNGNYEKTKKFLTDRIGRNVKLIQGDFRQQTILEQAMNINPISVGVIDCNIASSIEAAASVILKNICSGGILFHDDFFVNVGSGELLSEKIITTAANAAGRRLVGYNTYPPFARAFIVI